MREPADFFLAVCLNGKTAVRSSVNIDLLSLCFSVSQGPSLEDFPLTHACAIEKVTLWEVTSLLEQKRHEFECLESIGFLVLFSNSFGDNREVNFTSNFNTITDHTTAYTAHDDAVIKH